QTVKEEKLRSIYRRGNAPLFEMTICSIHLCYELLLIDTARPEAESILSPFHKSATARHQGCNPGPRGRFSFLFKAGRKIREPGGTVLSVCPSPNFFGARENAPARSP